MPPPLFGLRRFPAAFFYSSLGVRRSCAALIGILPPRRPARKGLLSQGGLADRWPLFQQEKAAGKRRSSKSVRWSLFPSRPAKESGGKAPQSKGRWGFLR